MTQSLAEDTTKPPARRLLPKHWKAWALGCALLFGTYLLAGFYWAPRLIRSEATDWVRTNLNKSIAIGEIKVNPLSFKVDISDIAIPAEARSGNSPMVAVGHLRLGFSPLSLFQDAWRLTELSIERPFVQATIRPDGSLNLLELVPPSHGGELPAVRIDLFSVKEGRIAYADHSRPSGPQETLTPITFTLRDFHTKKNEGGEFTLDGKSERAEGFAWRGTISMAPIASQGHFTIADLQAGTIARFLGDRLPVALTAGRIGVDGSYGFGYGAGGLRLNMTIPRLALNALAFDGQDRLLHAGAQIGEVVASLNFSIATGPRAPAPAFALSHLLVRSVTLSGSGPVKGETIRLASGALDNAKLDYAARRLDLAAASLAGLDIPLAREKDNVISLSHWLAALPQTVQAQAAPLPAAQPAWSVLLGTFALTDTAVHFEDRSVTPVARYELAPIMFTAGGVGTDMTKPVTVSLSATIDGKGAFKADGVVTPSTHQADLKLSLTGLPLKPAGAYLPNPALELRFGELSASGTLTIPGGEKPLPRFKGEGGIDKLSLYERSSKSELFAWRSLKLTGIDYRPGHVDMARARLVRPVGGVAILADRSFNFTPLMAPKVAIAAAAPSAAAPAMAFKLGSLDIEGGTLGFADHSIDPAFQARIEALQGSIKNIASTPDQIAAIDLKGQVIDRFSPVTIAGTANLLGYDKNTDIQVAFRNIELPIFNPYSGRYAGYAIAKGKLTTEMHYKIVNRALQADHHIVVDQLEWGQASASKPSVPWPVGLVTSLLKDRHGVIDLNLPVRGSLDDPTFRLGPVIWQIIGNLVEKIVLAPFDLIGSLFAGADKAQYIDFTPGSAAMPQGATDSLGALAKGLGDRPALQLDIPAAPALKEDAVIMADSRIDQLAMAKEIKKGQKADFAGLQAEEQHDRLEDIYRSKLGKRPAFPETLPALSDTKPAAGQPQPDADQQRQMQETAWLRTELRNAFLPSNAELAALGSARATAVRDALAGQGRYCARAGLPGDRTGGDRRRMARCGWNSNCIEPWTGEVARRPNRSGGIRYRPALHSEVNMADKLGLKDLIARLDTQGWHVVGDEGAKSDAGTLKDALETSHQQHQSKAAPGIIRQIENSVELDMIQIQQLWQHLGLPTT